MFIWSSFRRLLCGSWHPTKVEEPLEVTRCLYGSSSPRTVKREYSSSENHSITVFIFCIGDLHFPSHDEMNVSRIHKGTGYRLVESRNSRSTLKPPESLPSKR